MLQRHRGAFPRLKPSNSRASCLNVAVVVVSLGCTSRATQGGGEKLCELVMVQLALWGRLWREALGGSAVPGGWAQGRRPTIVTMLGILVVLCLIPAADVTGNRKNVIVSMIFQYLHHRRGETVLYRSGLVLQKLCCI